MDTRQNIGVRTQKTKAKDNEDFKLKQECETNFSFCRIIPVTIWAALSNKIDVYLAERQRTEATVEVADCWNSHMTDMYFVTHREVLIDEDSYVPKIESKAIHDLNPFPA